MGWFKCEHDWEIVTERREEATASKLINKGGEIKKGPASMLQDKYILVLKCNRCGRLNKTIENIG